MAGIAPSEPIIVRPFQPEDQDSAFRIWRNGILEYIWERSKATWKNKKLLACLGLGSAVPAAVLLSVSRQRAVLPTAAILAAGYAVVAAGIWAAAAPVAYALGVRKAGSWFKNTDMGDIQAKWAGADQRAFWVACLANGKVVGATALRMERPVPKEGEEKAPSSDRALEEGEAEVLRMTICGRQRRKGIGSKLLQAAEAHARSSGMTKVSLVTGSLPAMVFYERNGYTVAKETKYGDSFYRVYAKTL